MLYKFSFTLNKRDYFYSSLYYAYLSFQGIVSMIFTLVFWILLVYSLFTGTFLRYDILYRFLIVFCALLFPVIQPLVLYLKINKRFNKNPETETVLEFYDDKYVVKKDTKEANVNYNMIYKIKKYNKLVILFYNTIQGQLIPDRVFNNNKEEFYKFILNKKYEKKN